MREHPHSPSWQIQSVLPGMAWPAIPSGDNTAVLGLLFQLESSQWLPPDRLLELQLRQLEPLLRHAYASVPYYRNRWRNVYDPAQPLTLERFAALPLLTRHELQEHNLTSDAIPAAHGPTGEVQSSGSTGMPVTVLNTQLSNLLATAFTLRDHIWHRRDLGGKLAVIRYGVQAGAYNNWGVTTNGLVATGPSVVRNIQNSDVDTLLCWLEQQQPDYLTSYPSMIAALAQRSLEKGIRIRNLREARTFGEPLTPATRELCRTAWGVPIIDMYSANETGPLALQCPQHQHYHVHSEGALVEILDEQGKPCAAGETGRVVVTRLHNFAMPLVRYDLGDYAERGEVCPCGRGLPVIRHIAGRVRNMLVTANGKRYWPSFGLGSAELAPARQFQIVQTELDLIEARLVSAAPLTPEQEQRLKQTILSHLPGGLRLQIAYRDNIPRSAGGKYEDFVSEVSPPRI